MKIPFFNQEAPRSPAEPSPTCSIDSDHPQELKDNERVEESSETLKTSIMFNSISSSSRKEKQQQSMSSSSAGDLEFSWIDVTSKKPFPNDSIKTSSLPYQHTKTPIPIAPFARGRDDPNSLLDSQVIANAIHAVDADEPKPELRLEQEDIGLRMFMDNLIKYQLGAETDDKAGKKVGIRNVFVGLGRILKGAAYVLVGSCLRQWERVDRERLKKGVMLVGISVIVGVSAWFLKEVSLENYGYSVYV